MRIILALCLILQLFIMAPAFSARSTLPVSNCQTLTCVRKEIDLIDEKIVDLLVQRFAYVKKAGVLKRNRKHIHDCAREQEILQQVRKQADKQGLPGVIVVDVFKTILHESNEFEKKYHPFHN